MRKSKFSESRIAAIQAEVEAGLAVTEVPQVRHPCGDVPPAASRCGGMSAWTCSGYGSQAAPAAPARNEWLLVQLAGYVLDQFSGVPRVLRLQINVALVRKNHDRPEAVRQLMPQLRLAVVNFPDSCMRLNQLCQIADVTHETERKLSRGPCTSIQLDFKLFVKLVESQGRFFQISKVHVVCS